MLTGAFSMALVAGATIATFTAIPFQDAFGGWGPSLAIWAIPGVIGALVWLPLAARASAPVAAPDPEPLWRDRMAWSISLLMGLQSMAFFSTLSWLPEMLVDDGISEGYAGTLLGITQLIQIAPAFVIPVLAARRESQTGLLAVIVATAVIGLIGVELAPGAALLWMVWLGIGQGGALGLALILPVLRGRSAGQVASMTAMMMAAGYVLASVGPALVGATHDITHTWTWPIVVLLAMTLVQWPAGRYSAKGRA
jgi:CP family cyanate transporter-like MFS transporter